MKLAQYTRAERSIAATDGNTIRERWLYGLRLLADPEKLAPKGGLRNGVAEALVLAAKSHGIKLSAAEIRRRMQCARTYPTEAQFAQVLSEFDTWWELLSAGFPPVERPEGEPDADYHTAGERKHLLAQLMPELAGQGALIPLDHFEPVDTTLKQLYGYADEQDAITARFAETGRKRREYLDEMRDAVDGDLSATWLDAHRAAFPGTEPGDEDGPE